MADNAELLTRIVTFLRANPNSSARAIAAQVNATKSDVNSLLYRNKSLFKSEGEAPPLWKLVTLAVKAGDESAPPTHKLPNSAHGAIEAFQPTPPDEKLVRALADLIHVAAPTQPPPPPSDDDQENESNTAGAVAEEPDTRVGPSHPQALTSGPELTAGDHERLFRQRLSGKSLVLEADIDYEELNEIELILEARLERDPSVRRLAEILPALYAVYVVGRGIHSYDQGELWPHLLKGIADAASERGPAFQHALRVLDLDTLPELDSEPAMKHVSRILAHGGLPRSNIGDLTKALLTRMNRGALTADEAIAQWARYPSMFSTLDMPAQRFVRFCGDPARDFIQRMMDLILLNPKSPIDDAVDAIGLPNYVVEDVVELMKTTKDSSKFTGPRIRAPVLTLDPSGVGGPVLELPPAPEGLEYPVWYVTAEGAGTPTVRVDASPLSGEFLPVEPARRWEIALRDQATNTDMTWPIDGFVDEAAGLMLFDVRSFELLRNQKVVRSSEVMAVLAPGTKLVTFTGTTESAPHVTQQNPEMAGTWSKYSRDFIDVEGVTSLVARGASSTSTVFVKVREVPVIEGTTATGVSLADGGEVYVDDPVIRLPHFDPNHRGQWRISVSIDGASPAAFTDTDADESGGIFLGDLADNVAAVYNVVIRGPLGTDVRKSFGVVRGLEFQGPDKVASPGARVTTTLRSEDQKPSLNEAITFEPGVSRISLTLPRSGTDGLDLVLRIPRLTWALAQAGRRIEFDAEPIRLARTDLEAHNGSTLVVQTNTADQGLSLALLTDSGADLNHQDFGRTNRDGRWSFPLARYVDTVKSSQEAITILRLTCDSIQSEAVRITSVYNARLHSCEAVFDDAGADVILRVREDQPFRGRHVILWPTVRPWDNPSWVRIDDHLHDDLAFRAEGLRPGRYRVQLSLEDPNWRPPKRPSASESLAWECQLGTDQEVEDWLTSPRRNDAEQALEMFLGNLVLDQYVLNYAEAIDPAHVAASLAFESTRSGKALKELSKVMTLGSLAAAHGAPFWAALADQATRLDSTSLSVLTVLATPLSQEIPTESVDATTRNVLWDQVPPIAAAMDFVTNDDEARDRCLRFLEWHPDVSDDAPETFGPPEPQLLAMDLDGLEAIGEAFRNANGLTPRVFNLTEYQLPANLDWLREAHIDPGAIVKWSRRAATVPVDSGALPPPIAGIANSLIAKRCPNPLDLQTTQGALAALPHGMLRLAMALILNPASRPVVTHALLAACRFAPRLLTHDLILASAIAHMNPREND